MYMYIYVLILLCICINWINVVLSYVGGNKESIYLSMLKISRVRMTGNWESFGRLTIVK